MSSEAEVRDDAVSILLVDDQEAGMVALEATLAPLGQKLVRARSGREALRYLLQQDFAAVLLDVVMPEMDGFETAQLIRARERCRDTPILFLTGLSRGQMPELRAYSVGAVDFLHKPYEADILRSKVAVFVDLFRKRELVRRQAEALRDAQEREHARALAEAHQRVESERLRESEERLRQAVRLRDEFLSMASHELKTPLTSLKVHIQGALRAAARREEPVPVAQYVAKLETLEQNVGRLTQLVDTLLDITRISSGRLDFELGEVDLADVVREVAHRFSEEAERAGCELRVRAEAPVLGQWDRGRVDQVVTNLLSNALKYGAGRPVELSVGGDGALATLEVRDQGIGIAEEDRQRIFERFERAVPHGGFYAGFGLGLWIVRQIVSGLGGSVGVESVQGQGSTFRVLLPRVHQTQAVDVLRAAGA
jgi:signal transduction histidine kinase